MQANPQTSKHVLHISTPCVGPCAYAQMHTHLTKGKQQCTMH